MSLSQNPEYEKALKIDNRIRLEFYERLGHALVWCFIRKLKREKESQKGQNICPVCAGKSL